MEKQDRKWLVDRARSLSLPRIEAYLARALGQATPTKGGLEQETEPDCDSRETQNSFHACA